MAVFNPKWSVNSTCIHSVLQAAEALGGDNESLLAEVSIDENSLLEADNRFTLNTFLDLYALAEKSTQSADIGLYVGRVDYISRLNLQLYLQSTCQTLREYLNLMPSVTRFSGDIGEVQVSRESDFICLNWLPLWQPSAQQRFLTDQILTLSVMIVRSLCVQPISLLKACFSYPEPKDLTLLKSIFSCDLHFDQAVSRLYFHKDCLNYPLTQLNSQWGKLLNPSTEHLFAEQKTTDPFLAVLKRSVLQLMPTGTMSIDTVAAALNVSRRTLQRRLAAQGGQFQELVQALRMELAEQYIADQHLSLTEIAFLLGYADQGSFSGAFKSWFGLTPRDYRRDKRDS